MVHSRKKDPHYDPSANINLCICVPNCSSAASLKLLKLLSKPKVRDVQTEFLVPFKAKVNMKMQQSFLSSCYVFCISMVARTNFQEFLETTILYQHHQNTLSTFFHLFLKFDFFESFSCRPSEKGI